MEIHQKISMPKYPKMKTFMPFFPITDTGRLLMSASELVGRDKGAVFTTAGSYILCNKRRKPFALPREN